MTDHNADDDRSLDPLDIRDAVVERDADGNIVPEERTIVWDGEERDVTVVPVTVGHLADYDFTLSELANGIDIGQIQLLLQRHYYDPDLTRWSHTEFRDLEAGSLRALLSAFGLEHLADSDTTPEDNDD